MKTFYNSILAAFMISICLALSVSDVWAQKSITGMQDIAELYTIAENRFDLSQEDAVLLFDEQKVNWLPDGRLVNHIHRIIWIQTDYALEHYGDHRIPYDDAHTAFNVETVRTWRDNQWWTTGKTGFVETTPFALEKAYDYSNMREMMLLHNGIELPCILEVAYSIEDKEPFRKGADGLWTFARNEPAVQSWFCYGLPTGQKLKVFTSEGVPAPEKIANQELGLDTYWWKMGTVESKPRPLVNDPAAGVPYIVWSTWDSWPEYGKHLTDCFTKNIAINKPVKKSLDSLLYDARTEAEKADLIVDYINQKTRIINYPEHFWQSFPRDASRVFNTAYGHNLDRAILSAALFKNAGITIHPVYISRGYGNINDGIPSLSRMNNVVLWLTGQYLDAYYNPQSGTVENGSKNIYGRTVWIADNNDIPAVAFDRTDKVSQIDISINLVYNSKKEIFTGKGFLYADNYLSPYHKMEGLSNESKNYLNSVVSGLIKGAKITACNPVKFSRFMTAMGFELELKKPAPDDFERLSFEIGNPSGGIIANLPNDVHLYHQERASEIVLPCLMSQKVEFRLDKKGLDIIHTPADYFLNNGVGSFSVETSQHDDKVIISRSLRLKQSSFTSGDWPKLRQLLLSESSKKNITLLFKAEKDDKKDNQDEKDTASK